MKEYVLYGTQINEKRDYMEEILAVTPNESEKDFAVAKDLAKKSGFNRLHVRVIEVEKPNFIESLNI